MTDKIKHFAFRRRAIILLLFLNASFSHAQSIPDTLFEVRTLLQQKEVDQAFEMLLEYHSSHVGELENTWLLAQTAYWSGRFRLSNNLYLDAIALQPGNTSLILEYANMLTETGHLAKSRRILTQVTNSSPNHLQAWQSLARNEYYQANLHKAKEAINRALALDSLDEHGIQLKKDILTTAAPAIQTSFNVMHDDQPLQRLNPVIELRKRHSSFLNPSLRIELPHFTMDNENHAFQKFLIGNEFLLPRYSLQINIIGGIMVYPSDRDEWIGTFQLGKKIWKRLTMTGQWERKPYLSTVASLGSKVMEEDLSLHLGWEHPGSWNGEIFASLNQFPGDDNQILNMAGWFFAPSVNAYRLNLSLGYGFSFGHADDSRFAARHSLETIITNKLYLYPLEGFYKPYFTPHKQSVHAILGVLSFKPSSRFSFLTTLNYGFMAEASYPYLYLNLDTDGLVEIERDFQPTRFNPVEIKLVCQHTLKKRLSLSAEIRYNNTLFYRSLNSRLAIIIRL